MELQYRKRARLKLREGNNGKEFDFKIRYGLYEPIYLEDEDGHDFKCTVLYKIKERNSAKRFVIYTDDCIDKDEIRIYASSYRPFSLLNRICPIESEEDWEIVECFLDYINTEELK